MSIKTAVIELGTTTVPAERMQGNGVVQIAPADDIENGLDGHIFAVGPDDVVEVDFTVTPGTWVFKAWTNDQNGNSFQPPVVSAPFMVASTTLVKVVMGVTVDL